MSIIQIGLGCMPIIGKIDLKLSFKVVINFFNIGIIKIQIVFEIIKRF